MSETPLDDSNDTENNTEVIEAAPPAETREELLERHLRETVVINRYLYRQTSRVIRLLLEARDIAHLLDVLLVRMPRMAGFPSTELWFYDPEDRLRSLDPDAVREFAPFLDLQRDRFALEALYAKECDIVGIDAVDPRMFNILKAEDDVDRAVLVPLFDGEELLGSLHYAKADPRAVLGEAEKAHLRHFAEVVSLCIRNTVEREQLSQQTVTDTLTQFHNRRGFDQSLAQELSRSRRYDEAVSLLLVEIDELPELSASYGEATAGLLVKRVAERIASALRMTDHIARIGANMLAIVLPGSHEVGAGDVAERLRRDIERFSVDDGRGAVLQVTLSLGVVCWEPKRFPAVDMTRLARQLEGSGEKALARARADGGNRVAMSRLTTLMV